MILKAVNVMRFRMLKNIHFKERFKFQEKFVN